MASSPLLAVPSLNNSYGSIYIGMVVAGGLWGIATAQVYWYFVAYPRDPLSIKLLVSAAWGLDTVHQALISYLIYFYVITNFFNPLRLDFQIWVFSVQSLFEIIPCFIVQSFFLMRIWRLSNGKLALVILPALLIIAKMVLGIIWIGFCFRTKSILDAEARFHQISEAVNGLAVGGDILLGATMVWLLYMARTGVRQTDSMIAKLMIYTINTGVITSLCSIVTLAVALRFPKAYIYGAFYFCIGRLYVNTMLASLNARENLKGKSDVVEMSGVDFNSASHSGTTMTLGNSNRKQIVGKVPQFKNSQTSDDFVTKPGDITHLT